MKKEPQTQVLLHAAARAEAIRTHVAPVVESGKHVVSDRSWISSAVYQGAQGVALEDIQTINRFALGQYVQPDLVILLDADPELVAGRVAGSKPDYYESDDMTVHYERRERFLGIGHAVGATILDALQPQSVVSQQIREVVAQRLRI